MRNSLMPVMRGSLSHMIDSQFNSLIDFVLSAELYSVIYIISVYFLGLNIEEKNIIKGIIRKVFRK